MVFFQRKMFDEIQRIILKFSSACQKINDMFVELSDPRYMSSALSDEEHDPTPMAGSAGGGGNAPHPRTKKLVS